eukprot:1142673-Pelagomonas_calceolata.AAC.2
MVSVSIFNGTSQGQGDTLAQMAMKVMRAHLPVFPCSGGQQGVVLRLGRPHASSVVVVLDGGKEEKKRKTT